MRGFLLGERGTAEASALRYLIALFRLLHQAHAHFKHDFLAGLQITLIKGEHTSNVEKRARIDNLPSVAQRIHQRNLSGSAVSHIPQRVTQDRLVANAQFQVLDFKIEPHVGTLTENGDIKSDGLDIGHVNRLVGQSHVIGLSHLHAVFGMGPHANDRILYRPRRGRLHL